MIVLEWVGSALLLAGAVAGLVGAIGLHRFPDFFTRMHAASIIDTLCAGLMLSGLMLQAGDWLVAAKLAMILFFLLFTSPTASHALANTALQSGYRPWTAPEGTR